MLLSGLYECKRWNAGKTALRRYARCRGFTASNGSQATLFYKSPTHSERRDHIGPSRVYSYSTSVVLEQLGTGSASLRVASTIWHSKSSQSQCAQREGSMSPLLSSRRWAQSERTALVSSSGA
ncbi:hypothetical protein GY45DRAFT_250758 [Cubamyces sp. BRFM 1775]|nr:hypothetical protein GY45DRAFT_250758 [Cubamyces sp. BRFM 1775]